MAQQNSTTEIEIVHEGTPREKQLRSDGPDSEFHTATFIRVGKFRNEHVRVVGIRNGSHVYQCDVTNPNMAIEPNTINRIGGLGAYRVLPPTDEQIAAAIESARAAISA